jgi:hypothetical protein
MSDTSEEGFWKEIAKSLAMYPNHSVQVYPTDRALFHANFSAFQYD